MGCEELARSSWAHLQTDERGHADGLAQDARATPMPTRPMKVEQLVQRCWPTARVPQLSHS